MQRCRPKWGAGSLNKIRSWRGGANKSEGCSNSIPRATGPGMGHGAGLGPSTGPSTGGGPRAVAAAAKGPCPTYTLSCKYPCPTCALSCLCPLSTGSPGSCSPRQDPAGGHALREPAGNGPYPDPPPYGPYPDFCHRDHILTPRLILTIQECSTGHLRECLMRGNELKGKEEARNTPGK